YVGHGQCLVAQRQALRGAAELGLDMCQGHEDPGDVLTFGLRGERAAEQLACLGMAARVRGFETTVVQFPCRRHPLMMDADALTFPLPATAGPPLPPAYRGLRAVEARRRGGALRRRP